MQREATLLRAWEEAQMRDDWLRPIVVTAALGTDGEDAGTLADHPIGVVAARAMELANTWFGGDVEATVSCPACGADLEVAVAAADLATLGAAVVTEPFPFRVGDHELVARLPTPADVAAAAETGDPSTVTATIAERCLDGRPPGSIADDVEEQLAAELEQRDPLGAVPIDLTCPECGVDTETVLDVLAWWWARVDAYARRVMADVHRLACAYGWSEAETLAVGPSRRAAYLELVG